MVLLESCLSGKEHKITPQLGAAAHVILSQSKGAKMAFLQVNIQQMTKCHSSNVTARTSVQSSAGSQGQFKLTGGSTLACLVFLLLTKFLAALTLLE